MSGRNRSDDDQRRINPSDGYFHNANRAAGWYRRRWGPREVPAWLWVVLGILALLLTPRG